MAGWREIAARRRKKITVPIPAKRDASGIRRLRRLEMSEISVEKSS